MEPLKWYVNGKQGFAPLHHTNILNLNCTNVKKQIEHIYTSLCIIHKYQYAYKPMLIFYETKQCVVQKIETHMTTYTT